MVKNIVKCEKMLMLKSLPAVKEDLELQYDLRDTLSFYRQGCVGMAANMIGILKRIIIFINEKEESVVMFNPVILAASGEYEVEEGCLCLANTRRTKRYRKIKVEYRDREFKKRVQTYTGFTAQIIQHEIDHCDGILI